MELKIGKPVTKDELITKQESELDKPESKEAEHSGHKNSGGFKRSCNSCGQPMRQMKGNTNDGLDYVFFKCSGCGIEMVSTDQLHEIAAKSRALKTYNAKITKWGESLGIRIPKELVTMHRITHDEEVTIIPEDAGFRIVPAKKVE